MEIDSPDNVCGYPTKIKGGHPKCPLCGLLHCNKYYQKAGWLVKSLPSVNFGSLNPSSDAQKQIQSL